MYLLISCLDEGLNLLELVPLLKPFQSSWFPPPNGFFKVNWDAGINKSVQRTSFGVVIRDEMGDFKAANFSCYPVDLGPTVAEAEGALKAVLFAKELGIRNIIFEGDSQIIAKDLISEEDSLSEWSGCIVELKHLLKSFDVCHIRHVRRTSNEAAYCLAKAALQINETRSWFEVGPDFLLDVLKNDMTRSP